MLEKKKRPFRKEQPLLHRSMYIILIYGNHDVFATVITMSSLATIRLPRLPESLDKLRQPITVGFDQIITQGDDIIDR